MSTEINPQDPPIETPPAPVETPPAPDLSAEFRAELERERKARKDLEDRLRQKDEEALRKSKNWEELAKIKETEAQEYKQRHEALQAAIVQNEKLSRLKTECMKLGINPDALADLDLVVDSLSITVEATSTGKILVHGADSAAQLLKARRPFWFSNRPATVNTTSPGVSPIVTDVNRPTFEQLKQLEAEVKKNPSRENQEKYRAAILKYKA